MFCSMLFNLAGYLKLHYSYFLLNYLKIDSEKIVYVIAKPINFCLIADKPVSSICLARPFKLLL